MDVKLNKKTILIFRVTAAYLACKVEEFNVSLEQFVGNINGNKERAMEIILNHELLVCKLETRGEIHQR